MFWVGEQGGAFWRGLREVGQRDEPPDAVPVFAVSLGTVQITSAKPGALSARRETSVVAACLPVHFLVECILAHCVSIRR